VEVAKEQFAQLEGIRNWKIRAASIEVRQWNTREARPPKALCNGCRTIPWKKMSIRNRSPIAEDQKTIKLPLDAAGIGRCRCVRDCRAGAAFITSDDDNVLLRP
jgi:hypothetical protein